MDQSLNQRLPGVMNCISAPMVATQGCVNMNQVIYEESSGHIERISKDFGTFFALLSALTFGYHNRTSIVTPQKRTDHIFSCLSVALRCTPPNNSGQPRI